jgi:hypothetical protein
MYLCIYVSPLKGWLWSYCKFSLLPKPWQPSDDQVLMDVLDKSCSYHCSWSSLITLSLDRSGSDAKPKLYCWFFLKVFRWTWNWGFLGWSSLFIPCQSRLDQGCTVVLARDVVEQRMSHQRLRPISPCFHYFLPGNRPISPWFSGWNPICVRGLARDVVERRMSHLWISPCFWDWSLSFLSLFLFLLLEGIEQHC